MKRLAIVLCLLTWFLPSALLAKKPKRPDERRQIAGFFVPPAGPVKIAFFDADSTLRVAPSGGVTANGPNDVAILPMVADKLALLASEGYLLAIVSNQGGVPLLRFRRG